MLIRIFSVCIFMAGFSIVLISCGDDNKTETARQSEKTPPTIDELALLDTGIIYELPLAVRLYPKSGMDTTYNDSLAQLLVVPKGGRFRVFNTEMHGKTPWYGVRITGGPRSGWKNVAGTTLDSLAILNIIAENKGLPGWINHRDIEGQAMRYSADAEPSVIKKGKK